MNSAPPPGWYNDLASGRQRWWDGKAWGPVAPVDAVASTASPTRSETPARHRAWRFYGLALLGVAALAVVLVVVVTQLVGAEPDERSRLLGEEAGLGTAAAWQRNGINFSEADIERTCGLMRDDAIREDSTIVGDDFFEACVASFE